MPDPSPYPYPFRNLVFEGGGVKGIAYLGALSELEERGILPRIERVGGTSAGAINATLLALGYTLAEIRDIVWNLDFRSFLDDSWGVLRDARRLVSEYGWYRGDFFHAWISKLVEERTGDPNADFRRLARRRRAGARDLYLIGANLSTGFAEIFSLEHTPDVPIADAVRISMSLPLFFTSVRSPDGEVYVDGGLLNNYPVKLFDHLGYIASTHFRETLYYKEENLRIGAVTADRRRRRVYNQETLGFRLDSEREIAHFEGFGEPRTNEIADFFDYTLALLRTLLNVQNDAHLHSDDWHRTVYIDTLGVGTTDFDLADETKEALVRSGAAHTRRYFDWWTDASEAVHNRPDIAARSRRRA